METTINKSVQSDKLPIWNIFKEVISTGDTYVFDPSTSQESFEAYWFSDYATTTFTAKNNATVVGSYILKPNQIDLGNHIANCSYMVHPDHRGQGIGRMLCQHSIDTAKAQGYLGIQFNIVVSTNTGAVHLWKSFGFEIIGTTPKGFRHQTLGYVDSYIMFKQL